MSESLRLSGQRIVVEEVRESDLDQLHDWFLESDPQRLTCRPIEPITHPQLHARFARSSTGNASCTYAVRLLGDSRLVGRITYFDVNPRNRSAEVGFLTGPQFRRQGYTAEALALVLGHLFRDLNMNKVMAQTGAFNDGAIRLLLSLGFREDGRLRRHHVLNGEYYDDVLFSLLAEEFCPDSLDP
ncbi:MAG: GNAT family N-acetyltransferase [candidate division Zixibacteria bacterium]|nr:GNAT family N-acetyltransferase [candidate division Zixibacteria bacterium]